MLSFSSLQTSYPQSREVENQRRVMGMLEGWQSMRLEGARNLQQRDQDGIYKGPGRVA